MTSTHTPSALVRLPQPEQRLDALQRLFREEGYVPLPGFLTAPGLLTLQAELRRLELVATRRDFEMQCMNNSPRHMTTVGGHVIDRESRLIADLYKEPRLLDFLRAITDLPLVSVPDPLERHVANYLHQPRDTHGAHFDDFPVALLLFIETPDSPEAGGLLEFVANAEDLAAIDTDQARRAFHTAGDAYLLRSDTTAHRVTPLRQEARRVVLNFAYATPAASSITTPSASLLYG